MSQVTSTLEEVRFEVPDVFTPIDLTDDPGERVQRLLAKAPGLTQQERLHLVVAQEMLVEGMRTCRVGYAATCLTLVEDNEPRLSVAQFTVASHPAPTARQAVLTSLAEHLACPGFRRDVGFVMLPAGRALAVVEERRFRSEKDVLGRTDPRERVVHQIQLMLLHPARSLLVVLSLTTESIRDTGAYLDLMGLIGASVTFESPDGDARPIRGAISSALDDHGMSGDKL